jgi:hypothetical protein
MTKRKGPRDDGEDGDGYGYDPARKVVRDLFERAAERAEQDDRPARKLKDVVPKVSPVKKRLIDARVAIQTEEQDEFFCHHSVFCQTSLPFSKTDKRVWERKNGTTHLKITAGDAMDPVRRELVELPLPYGEKPRLILLYLSSEARRTGSRIIDVGESLTGFVRMLGIPTKGREIKAVRQQLARLAACRMVIGMVRNGQVLTVKTDIIDSFSVWEGMEFGQPSLWPSRVELSEKYAASLEDHAVPLDMRAIASLRHSAMALDIYAWLAQRLHHVPVNRPQFIPWAALHVQFGHGYREIRKFRAFFLHQLKQVKGVYPDARFDTDGRGMTLWNSRPPISKRLRQVSSGTVIDGKATEVPD